MLYKYGLTVSLAFFAMTGVMGDRLVGMLERVESPASEPGNEVSLSFDGTPGSVTVESRAKTPVVVHLGEWQHPDIRTGKHAVWGNVRYRDVVGESYLETWSVYGKEERYFSRTLARGGPLKALKGTAGRRPFVLPFRGVPGRAPERVEFNLVLQGSGTVELQDVRLMEISVWGDPFRLPGSWWGPRVAGLFAGIIGGSIGLAGGVFGWLASRGRARKRVFQGLRVLVCIGLAIFLVGIVALVCGQPSTVVFPLVLVGGLTLFVFGTSRRGFQRSYENCVSETGRMP